MAEIVDFGLQQHKIKMDSRYFENVLSVVAGDTGRRIEVQLLDTNGTVQNTTGLNLRLNAEIAGKATFTDATLVDAPTGKYQLDLSNGMFLAPGNWQFQWLITDTVGKKLHSFAFTGNVGSNISEGGSQATNFYLNLEDLKAMQEDLVNGTIDSSILETNIAEKLTDLETQYAPKLTEVTAQLAETEQESRRKRKLEDLDSEVLLAIEGGEGTSFELLSIPQNNSVTTEKIVERAVTPETTSFLEKGKNEIDDSKFEDNTLVSYTTGETVTHTAYQTSVFEPIADNAKFTQNKSAVIAFYDNKNIFISGLAQVVPYVSRTFTTPENTAFYRTSVNKELSPVGSYQIEKGSVSTPYEKPYLELKGAKPINGKKIDDYSVSKDKLDFEVPNVLPTINLHDEDSIIPEYFINQTNGLLIANIGHKAYSAKIKGLESITFWAHDRSAFYTETGAYISGSGLLQTSQTPVSRIVPPNASIVKYSIPVLMDMKQVEKGLEATEYVPNGFTMPKLINGYTVQSKNKSDNYGKWNLKNFLSQASKYQNESFDERLEIAILGDSWVDTTYRIAGPMRKKLVKEYGDGGIGFAGFSRIRIGNGEVQITTTGVWETINYIKGLDMRQYQSNEIGATIKLTTYEPSNQIEIHHIQQVGSYRYRLNGGSWITVDTATTTAVKNDNFTKGNVVMDIEVLSGTVTLLNAYLFNGNRGVVVHQWGFGGATSSQYANVDKEHFIGELQKTTIKTIFILLGTNDMSQYVSIESFKKNIKEMINRIKEANSLIDIALVAPSGNNLIRNNTMKEFSEALAEVAQEKETAFVSLYENMGTYEEQNNRNLFIDDVHPNVDGGYVIGNVVYDRLLRI